MDSRHHSNKDKERAQDREHAIKPAGEKGKGKAKPPAIVDTGRIVLAALMASATPARLARTSKSASDGRVILSQSGYGLPSESRSHRAVNFEPSATMKTMGKGIDSAQAYESFLVGAQASLPSEPGAGQIAPVKIAGQTLFDGQEVVELLSLADEAEQPPDSADEPSFCTLAGLDQLRQAFFGSESQHPFCERLLDFSPDFLTNPGASQEAETYFGTVGRTATRRIWFQQWHDVLASYNDQVWGDLGPLVAEARLEVDIFAVKPPAEKRTPATTALDRLRQILMHVRCVL